MIKVLHITTSLHMGGVEKLVYELVTSIERTQFHPMVCTFEKNGIFQEDLEKAGIPVFVMKKRKGIDYSLPIRLARLFRKLDADIIHTHNVHAWLYGGIGALFSGPRLLIHTEHAINPNRGRIFYLARFLLSQVTSRIVSVAAPVSRVLSTACKISPKKIILVPNGVHIQEFENSGRQPFAKQKRLNFLRNKKVIGIVARLTEAKDHMTLIQSFELVNQRCPESCLVIVGEGELRKKLEAVVRGLGLENKVFFLGQKKNIPEILSDMDLFVLSSIREGLPVTLLEAMASGRPVVATDVGGTREIISQNETGLLVPPGNPKDMASAILSLLDDEKGAAKMGRKGQERVRQKFSFEEMMSAYQNIYVSLLGLKGQ